MLKPIWFLIKIVLLVVIVAWLAARPGEIEILWNGYLVQTSFGAFLAMLIVLIVVCALLYRFWRSLVSMPQVMRRYKEIKGRERGFEAVTKGLVAVASGDARGAEKQASRARKLVPDTPLSRLLMAQSALMNGNDNQARIEFESLLEDKNAAFFGLRGLMNQAFKRGDNQKALELLRTAEALHPKRDWIVESLFQAEVGCKDWVRADQTLTKAIKFGVFDRETGRLHRQAILIAQAQSALLKQMDNQALSLAKRAFKAGEDFRPASILYARLLIKAGRRRKAIAVVEKAWSVAPHPDLANAWQDLEPVHKGKTDEQRKASQLHWYKRLYNLSSYRTESNAMLGRIAMDLGLYDEAREWLKIAGEYTLLAKLERLDGRFEIKSREWLERAARAKPNPQWVCESCGNITAEWEVLCSSCHDFNSIEWRSPQSARINTSAKKIGHGAEASGFIEPPQD